MSTNLNGYFEDKTHYYPVRIHYADTDAGGVIYHSRYLELAERARAAFLNIIDVPEAIYEEHENYFWVVRKAEIDYRAPAKVMDVIDIKSEITQLNLASLEVVQTFIREDKTLVTIKLTLAFVNEKGRVKKIMPSIRHKMVSYIQLSKREGNKHG